MHLNVSLSLPMLHSSRFDSFSSSLQLKKIKCNDLTVGMGGLSDCYLVNVKGRSFVLVFEAFGGAWRL